MFTDALRGISAFLGRSGLGYQDLDALSELLLLWALAMLVVGALLGAIAWQARSATGPAKLYKWITSAFGIPMLAIGLTGVGLSGFFWLARSLSLGQPTLDVIAAAVIVVGLALIFVGHAILWAMRTIEPPSATTEVMVAIFQVCITGGFLIAVPLVLLGAVFMLLGALQLVESGGKGLPNLATAVETISLGLSIGRR